MWISTWNLQIRMTMNGKIKEIQYLDIGIWTCKRDLRINASPLPCYEGTWATNGRKAFTSILHLEDSEKSLTLINVFLQIRQTYWSLFNRCLA
jgi:hypothetical protein